MHKFSEKQEISISFNGGKDSTVVLYLYILTLKLKEKEQDLDSISADIFESSPDELKNLRVLYFDNPGEFEEMKQFVAQVKLKFGLNFQVYKSSDTKQAIQELVNTTQLKGILMGTRRTDPHSEKLNYFEDSSAGWPLFTRILPILDWKYSQIWEFLRFFKLPYCCLYDEGYTSISLKHNTPKNELLKQQNGDYLPAYMLEEGDKNERIGRGTDVSFK